MGKQTTSSGYYYGGPYIHSIDYNHPNIPEEYKDIFSSSDSYAFLFTDTNNVSVSQAQKNFIGSHPEIQELIEKIMPKYIEKKHKKDLLLEEKALNEKRIDNLIKTKESLKTDKENLKNQLDMLKYLPENLKAFAHELATFNRKAIPDIISRYEKNPQADFLVFDNEKGKEFLLFCIENHLTPCLDGEHFIAIGLTERKVDS
ncbi:MAG: hypothetical protein LBO09_04140 [Candidatus Peribacteria bacterium]|jgi:hypothetical protein|nr:hypothetical protein [Candidatus Peribacteria bacterium]